VKENIYFTKVNEVRKENGKKIGKSEEEV